MRKVAIRSASIMRICYFRMAYSGVSIGFDCYIGPGCEFFIGDRARLVLRGVHLGRGCELDVGAGAMVDLASVWIGQHCVLAAREGIAIGAGTMIAEMAVIRDADLGRVGGGALIDGPAIPISIGRDVWLGAKATVLRGVTIGDSATVGAGAVVTRDVLAGATVVGVPARPILRQPAPPQRRPGNYPEPLTALRRRNNGSRAGRRWAWIAR